MFDKEITESRANEVALRFGFLSIPLYNLLRRITMQLNASEIQDLIKLVQYTVENESTHYDEFVESGGKPNDHIYWTARRLLTTLQSNTLS